MENNDIEDFIKGDILSSLPPSFQQQIISLIKKKDDDLNEYKERYELLVKSLNEGILLEGIEGNFTFVNPRAAEILKYTELELLGKQKDIIIPSEELNKFERDSVKHHEGISSSFQCNLLTKDGNRVPVFLTTVSLISTPERSNSIVYIFTDITERKKAEEALHRSEERYRMLVELSPDAILLLDLNANIVVLNQQTVMLYSYETENELIGKSVYDLIIPNDHQYALKNMKKTIELGALNETEYTMIRKDGSKFSAEISTSVIKDELSHPLGFFLVARDVTERKKTQEERESLAEKRREFMDKTAHELRTPITIIKGYTEFLMKQEEDERKIYFLDVIMKNLHRLEDLSSDVSDIYKIERGKLEVNLEKMEIIEFLTSFIEPYIRLYQGQIRWINLNVKEKIIINGDPKRLKNVLGNVLENAINNSQSKTRNISIELSVSDIEVQIIVTDNGAGIEPDNLEKIFDKFVSYPTEYNITGTGIGLYISSEIISLHNGSIYAYSEGRDTGTTLTINLPKLQD